MYDARPLMRITYTDKPAPGSRDGWGHGGMELAPPSAIAVPLLEELLTAKETGSRITPARTMRSAMPVIRFILESLLEAHFLAWNLEAVGIRKNVHETEQR